MSILKENPKKNEIAVPIISLCTQSDLSHNRLAAKLNLSQGDPLFAFERNPCAWTLSRISKKAQTPEMVQKAIENDSGSQSILKHVAKKLLTEELCLKACQKNGGNLRYVPDEFCSERMFRAALSNRGDLLSITPDELKTYELCEIAISGDEDGIALKYVPGSVKSGPYGANLYRKALEKSPYAVAFVPSKFITKKIAADIIHRTCAKDSLHTSFRRSHNYSWPYLELDIKYPDIKHPIFYIPKKYWTEDLLLISITSSPSILQSIPQKFLTESLCQRLVHANPEAYEFLPNKYKCIDSITDSAISSWKRAIRYVPEEMKTESRYRVALKQFENPPEDLFPPEIYKDYLESRNSSVPSFLNYFPQKILTSDSIVDFPAICLSGEPNAPILYNLAGENEEVTHTIFYISDLHLEHQIPIMGKQLCEVTDAIQKKVGELVDSLGNGGDTILFAGDIADCVELESYFFKLLLLKLREKGLCPNIISILGNHELWNVNSESVNGSNVETIVDEYRQSIPGIRILENSLYLNFKNEKSVCLPEKTILQADEGELSEICRKSSLIILAGNGFSGLDPVYNASMGLYRDNFSYDDDIARSKQFENIYKKVLACAAREKVIVLTHTPLKCWSKEPPNPNWIYINGHTHQNFFIHKSDGTTILSDNQIGYEPTVWRFKGFLKSAQYDDPFLGLDDGIYEISVAQYIDFNRSNGIFLHDFKRMGKIYMVKRQPLYMFFLNDVRLYLLEGGHIHTTNHDIMFYYNNLLRYKEQLEKVFAPYREALIQVSDEIKAIGGYGDIHGCIVDIDFYNHIFINPYDGSIVPYFAYNTTEKLKFKDVGSLMEGSPYPPHLLDGTSLAKHYFSLMNEGRLSILGQTDVGKHFATSPPELVLDRSMYNPSRIFRSIQYIFENNTVRIWMDEILDPNFRREALFLED